MQNYPNPFNPTTTIQYTIPINVAATHESPLQRQHISLKVYNILGKEVATLVNENQKPGRYSVTWNATNQPNGIYFYRITADNFTETKRMVLLK
jgi:flagellar hook assembly protein FlgD